MTHPFLSDDWYAAVDALDAPAPPPELADLTINLRVTDGPDGDAEANMTSGTIGRGHVDGAPTTITVEYDVAKAMLIEGNPQAAMQAFMSGRIKVEGDMTKLLAMQSATTSPEQDAFQDQIKGLTA